MPRLFRGKDRRFLLVLKKVLELSVRREFRILDPKPSTELSTREPFFDGPLVDPVNNMADVVSELGGRVDHLLALNQGQEAPHNP